ncbi:hypothetical protein ICC18_05220 [Paenibacillus sp. WST5]|uniref:Uncharacterized protein n=2 Tax=Paenibacillus sedimenti TaxID=2770274 RepID=A0A926KLJ3_9BACL|nr:hypothetical protein [Paenibacillus sedimenti]
MFLYEWPKIDRIQKKEKMAFVALTAMGCLLAILVIYYPEMSSPTQWVERIYRPLGKLLEQ